MAKTTYQKGTFNNIGGPVVLKEGTEDKKKAVAKKMTQAQHIKHITDHEKKGFKG